jgi:hypothetical protein
VVYHIVWCGDKVGLDIYCKCGETSFRAGSYNGFHEWRVALASLNGMDLTEMEGFGGDKRWTRKEPFYELLSHCDCEGDLTEEECRELMKDFKDERKPLRGLSKILKTQSDRDWFKSHWNEWKDAITHATVVGCELEFG